MKIPDANVLLYAVNETAEQHAVAASWFGSVVRAREPVGFAWIALLAFLRLSTRDVVFPRPLDTDRATAVIAAWLALPSAVVVHPTERHVDLMRGLLRPLGTAGNLVSDAHLAALALEHGGEIVTFDRDLTRFAGVRCEILS